MRFSSPRLGGALTGADLARIESVAVEEVRRAFAGLRLRVSTAQAARYHVRVAQEVRDARFRRPVAVCRHHSRSPIARPTGLRALSATSPTMR